MPHSLQEPPSEQDGTTRDVPPAASEFSVMRTLLRGLCRRCPRCGKGNIFDGWYNQRESCAACGLVFEPNEGDTWGFMYITTAGITGVIIVAMLLIRPDHLLLGRVVIFLVAMATIVFTLPFRKGFALALEYVISLRHRE